jgi:hypothetical protein
MVPIIISDRVGEMSLFLRLILTVVLSKSEAFIDTILHAQFKSFGSLCQFNERPGWCSRDEAP